MNENRADIIQNNLDLVDSENKPIQTKAELASKDDLIVSNSADPTSFIKKYKRLIPVVMLVLLSLVLLTYFYRPSKIGKLASTSSSLQQPVPKTTKTINSLNEKPPIKGLIDMGIQTPYQTNQPFPVTNPNTLNLYAGAFNGIVINESWSQLEPNPNQENWQSLDNSIAAVKEWNNSHPKTPLAVKLRIFAGYSAPTWVVAASGGTVTIFTSKAHNLKILGKWWTSPFEQAWNNFQHALADRYDSNSLVRAVSVSSCSSSTGEPFVVSGAISSQKNLSAAGWTVQAQENCLSNALNDYSGWKHTQITFAFTTVGGYTNTTSFMDQIMQNCANSKASGGPDCVVGNNDLSPLITSSSVASPVYREITNLEDSAKTPVAVYFQTVGEGLSCSSISLGQSYHASSIELWPPNGYPGFSAIPVSTLISWNNDLTTGNIIKC